MIRSFLVVLLLMSAANAEEAVDPRVTPELLEAFAAHEFDDDGFTLPYRLMSPKEVDPVEKRPLVVFLHGFGERGDDNQRQLIHGGPSFVTPEFRDRHRAFVLAPQCPAGNKLDSDGNESDEPIVWSLRLRPTNETLAESIDDEPTAPMHAVRALVDHLIEMHPIDTKRLYITGLSMGGYGTWELASREPNLWAAAAPICGGGNPAWAERLKGLPLWCFHGDADGAVPVVRSREMISAISAAGGRPIYTEYPGVNHDSWTQTYKSRYLWDWMFAQSR